MSPWSATWHTLSTARRPKSACSSRWPIRQGQSRSDNGEGHRLSEGRRKRECRHGPRPGTRCRPREGQNRRVHHVGRFDRANPDRITEKAIVSGKGGENVNVAMVRDLAHVVDREKAKIGVFITLADSTGPIRTEAVKTGYYETLYGKYPKVQILTIRELFEGKQPNIPLVDASSFKKAPKEARGDQDALPF